MRLIPGRATAASIIRSNGFRRRRQHLTRHLSRCRPDKVRDRGKVENSGSPSVLKWIGVATAILSLIAGIRALTKPASDRAEARRKVEALLASERIQAQ